MIGKTENRLPAARLITIKYNFFKYDFYIIVYNIMAFAEVNFNPQLNLLFINNYNILRIIRL